MKKFGIAIAALALAAAPLAAHASDWISGGAGNLTTVSANSGSGVSSEQGTQSGVESRGNGSAVMGTVGGNYTSIQTGAEAGKAGTSSYTTQTNVGGDLSGGETSGHAAGTTSGTQGSEVGGGSHASLSSATISGFSFGR